MQKVFLKSLFLSVFLCLFSSLQAQRQYTQNINTWWAYAGNHKLSDKWGLHLEMQFRRSDGILKNMQVMPRVGVHYYLTKQITLTAGYAFVETYPYGGFPVKSAFPEHRLWEQVQTKNNLGLVEFLQRLRLEQRFVHLPSLSADGTYKAGKAIYSNRIRLLERLSIPLNGQPIADHSWYIALADEVFVNFGKNVGLNIFDQNRGFIGVGYVLPKWGRLELGYLNQLLFKSDGIKVENNHTLQLSLSSSIEFRKRKDTN